MKFRNLIIGAVAVLASAVSIAAANAQESKIDEIRERGTLRMAGILNEDPYFAKDPRTGEWRGFAVAMARDIAETMGVELEVVESSWGNSILDVQSGKVDLALVLTALPKRALSIHFSSPTYYNSFVIVSPKAELSGKSWAELNDASYTIAVDAIGAGDGEMVLIVSGSSARIESTSRVQTSAKSWASIVSTKALPSGGATTSPA